MDNPDQDTPSQAEELRLQGNAAFVTKDWNTSIQKYKESIKLDNKSKNSAKVYSNLAAALCKICKYDDAYEAATMAPKLDPGWAKGHWRAGVVAELQKDFMHANMHYEFAAKLAPDEAIFKNALDKINKRLGCDGEVAPNGLKVMKMPPGHSYSSSVRLPYMVAWDRYKLATNDLTDPFKDFPEHFDPSSGEDIKSDKFIAHRLYHWWRAMSAQLGDMATLPFHHKDFLKVRSQVIELQANIPNMSTEQFHLKRYMITGCPPSIGNEFQDLLAVLSALCGEHLPCETGDPGRLVPSPPWLKWYTPQQFFALQMAIFEQAFWLKNKLSGENMSTYKSNVNPKSAIWTGKTGEMMILPQAIIDAASGYCGNIQYPMINLGKAGTPEEVVAYCKKKISQGVAWGDGIRQFVSLCYRGPVLQAWLTRLMGHLGEAMKHFKWARKFINLADDEWSVTAQESFSEKGSCFKKSFQVGVLCMELVTSRTRRNNELPKLEEAVYEFNLAQDIISGAMTWKEPADDSYFSWLDYVAFHRKPLAIACTYLASTINSLLFQPNILSTVFEKTGVMDAGADDSLYALLDKSATQTTAGNIHSLIAETYKNAAIAQLDDDNETPILWWGYAAHLSRAGGYKMCDLRTAINNAADASQKRDADLFGPEPPHWHNSSYKKEALMLARYYDKKKENFILPPLILEPRPDGNIAVFVDGNVLCMNFEKFLLSDVKNIEKSMNKDHHAYLDTSEVEKEHGAGENA